MRKRSGVFTYVLFYAFVLILLLSSGFGASTAVTVIAQNTPMKDRSCIIVDAGHGGVDGGATSCTGVLESQINLQISLRLNDLLQLLGYHTKMIRTEDISVYTEGNSIAAKKVSDLKNRVKTINDAENAILVSIHQNYFQESKYSGTQVFYNKEGELLGKQIQKAAVSILNPTSHRQAKKAEGIYLMEHAQCPAALIECGFISNPEEEGKLLSADYQKKLICVIGGTLSSYLNT